MRKRNLFDPLASAPFKLSRSRLENFIRCARCFYLDRRFGIDQPPGYPFNLNSAVDHLLKKEFDYYRARGKAHPLMKAHGVAAAPYAHPDLEEWRDPFKGVRHHHKASNFMVFGGIDDIWVRPNGELVIVDYKATSVNARITMDDPWKIGYKRQMEIYQWLFRANGYKVSDIGYFVYCNGLRDEKAFSDTLKFCTVILPYAGDSSWVDGALVRARKCLEGDEFPEPAEGCEFCLYRREAAQAEASRPREETLKLF